MLPVANRIKRWQHRFYFTRIIFLASVNGERGFPLPYSLLVTSTEQQGNLI